MSEQININDKIRVGITHGDCNGIGYEIIIKSFLDQRMNDMFTPIVFGSSKIASYHRKSLNINDFSFNIIDNISSANVKRANLFNCVQKEVKIELGESTPQAGDAALIALKSAVEHLKQNNIDVVVTAPINKNNIQSDTFHFPGHTEFFAKSFHSEKYLMLMVSEELRIGTVTGHIPINKVSEEITTSKIIEKLEILQESLIMDFGIVKPRIAVLSLNPHCGDEGVIGKEDDEIVRPAIEKAFENGIFSFGPFPTDGFFGSGNFKKYDAILAMYHDQGLIPFKLLARDGGVNFTAGLPIVRTSPAHGTAYEIAGKNIANPESMRSAIYLAKDIFIKRNEYIESNTNPLGYSKNANTTSKDDDLPASTDA